MPGTVRTPLLLLTKECAHDQHAGGAAHHDRKERYGWLSQMVLLHDIYQLRLYAMQTVTTSQVNLVHVSEDELFLLYDAPDHATKETSKAATYSTRCNGGTAACVCITVWIGPAHFNSHAANRHNTCIQIAKSTHRQGVLAYNA